jgi:DNA-binding response OmpR family regulator
MCSSTPGSAGRSALIVEDELLISMAIQLALEEIGFNEFAIATTEGEAVKAARARRPDLITADVRLRDGNGLRAVEEIWTRGHIPTVFITATTTRLPAAFNRGAVMQKPFTAERLKDTVRDLLARAPVRSAS